MASTAERRWMESLVLPSSCVTPAGTSIEVQNEWEENTHAHRRRKVDDKSCVTPADTSNEFDVQNKWEENTRTQLLAANVCL